MIGGAQVRKFRRTIFADNQELSRCALISADEFPDKGTLVQVATCISMGLLDRAAEFARDARANIIEVSTCAM